jgi:hypothetical protein
MTIRQPEPGWRSAFGHDVDTLWCNNSRHAPLDAVAALRLHSPVRALPTAFSRRPGDRPTTDHKNNLAAARPATICAYALAEAVRQQESRKILFRQAAQILVLNDNWSH